TLLPAAAVRHPCACLVLELRRAAAPALFPYTPLFRSTSRGRRLKMMTTLETTKGRSPGRDGVLQQTTPRSVWWDVAPGGAALGRSEEHTSELQSRFDLVCRLLLEKKNRAAVADGPVER